MNQEQENMLKDMDFYHKRENIRKTINEYRVDSLKTASKKVVHKAGEFLGKKPADVVTQVKQ